MESKIDFSTFCKKYNVCDHCKCYLEDPETISQTVKAAANPERFESLTIDPFNFNEICEKEWECSMCLGMWGLFHCQDFYLYILKQLQKSGYQFKNIQVCMWIPLTMRLR